MYTVMWIALAIGIVIPIYLSRRGNDMLSGFKQLLAERRFTPRTDSPVAIFSSQDPPRGFHLFAVYDGELRPRVPICLLMFKRTESVLMQGVPMQTSTVYVGVYLPPQVKLDASWLAQWEDKVARNKDGVAYAAPVAEGGIVIIWQGEPERKVISKNLAALADSIPIS
jgi:hypothetical protein